MSTKLIVGGLAALTTGVLVYRGFIKKFDNGLTWYQAKVGKNVPPRTIPPAMGTDVNTNQPAGPVSMTGADGSKSIVGRFDPRASGRIKKVGVGAYGTKCFDTANGKYVPCPSATN